MYLIHELAELSGTTTRTLRYYDDIGLLKPDHVDMSGYRRYTDHEVDRLQQILMYKKLGFDLKKIKAVIDQDIDQVSVLHTHLQGLYKEMSQLTALIKTIEKTISYQKGDYHMTDQEKFEGLKEKDIKNNEKMYGKEVREKYGHEAVDQSNKKYKEQSQQEYIDTQKLSIEILDTLKEALIVNDPNSDIAQHVCELHQIWIKKYWTNYDKKAHLALVNMYLEDKRFKAYYEKVGKGATELLVDAMKIYLNKY